MNTKSFTVAFACALLASTARGQAVRVTLDDAIQLALAHNHSLRAARTTIQQNMAQEITANLHPNPTFFTDWDYIPLTRLDSLADYLKNSTEADIGLSYLFERGNKRFHRLQAARDATAVTRSQVEDNERGLSFQVASLFINVQLAESSLALALENLKSFQNTVEIAERQYKSGAISENDSLKIKLQLLQFQTDVQQAQLARAQALSDLRQLLGFDSVPADYEIAGAFEFQPLVVSLDELQRKALQNRPDLRAAQQSVNAANSQHDLAKANGKQDFTLSANCSSTASVRQPYTSASRSRSLTATRAKLHALTTPSPRLRNSTPPPPGR